jgi:heptosyltransferase-2
MHQIEYYRSLVKGLGIEGTGEEGSARPRMAARSQTLTKADALLRERGAPEGARLVGFAPGAAYGHAKQWPPDRVAAVIAGLHARGATAVLVGAPADRETARAIESSLPPGTPIVDLVGRTTLRQLVGVVARCAAFVSNDSGAMHVAAALGNSADGDLRADRRAGDVAGRPSTRGGRAGHNRPRRVLPAVPVARVPHRSSLHETD